MYKRRPAGDYLVSVCTNTLCDVLGGEEIYRALSEHLGVGHDETTADGRITLEHAECLAACDYAPVVTVNYEFFDQQSHESALGLVGELQAGRQPMPTRGAPLCTFKEISRQLAGFLDERPGALDAGPAGEPTLVGNRLAVQRGETAPAYGEPTPLDGDRRAAPAPAAAPAAPGGGCRRAGARLRMPASTRSRRAGRPGVRPDTAAERSAGGGTARYGGQPDEPSSGGGEGGAGGLDTSASDPDVEPRLRRHPRSGQRQGRLARAGHGGDPGSGPATPRRPSRPPRPAPTPAPAGTAGTDAGTRAPPATPRPATPARTGPGRPTAAARPPGRRAEACP